MRSKTKIMVVHLKELVYTGIFALLGIFFIVLIIIVFMSPKDKKVNKEKAEPVYVPGVYSAAITLGESGVDIEVVVDASTISSIRMVNLNESITTMYPLLEPAFAEIARQVYEKQDLSNITYSDDSKYTSMILLEAIQSSLDKARKK